MIDFTKSVEELNTYKGSEKKKTLIYNNKRYLVKFPDPVREKNKLCCIYQKLQKYRMQWGIKKSIYKNKYKRY